MKKNILLTLIAFNSYAGFNSSLPILASSVNTQFGQINQNIVSVGENISFKEFAVGEVIDKDILNFELQKVKTKFPGIDIEYFSGMEIKAEGFDRFFSLVKRETSLVHLKDRSDILKSGLSVGNGTYGVFDNNYNSMNVECDMTTSGGGWTIDCSNLPLIKKNDMKKGFLAPLMAGSISLSSLDSSYTLVEPMAFKERPAGEAKVFGLSQRDVLAMDGDPRGKACSYEHKNDDLSNRWCHAMVAKLGSYYFEKIGFSSFTSALLSGLVFIPKEYMYDKNPSRSDLVAAEIPIYTFDDHSGEVDLTVFGDGSGVISLEKFF